MSTIGHGRVTEQVDVRHWRVVLGRLEATFRTDDLAHGAAVLARIAELAEASGHHPDVDLRHRTLHVSLVPHDVHGLTDRDVVMARSISVLADELGLDADPAAPQRWELAVDALDISAVVPFWRAVLGYVPESPEEDEASPVLVDPAGRGPAVWFQQMDAPRPQRNRLHVDLSVPHDVARARVRAAVDAGGRVVSEDRAPAFWVLADPEGNEICVCTWQGRPSA